MKSYIDVDPALLDQFYTLDNYKVIDKKTNNLQKKAVIYCTSNALYVTKPKLPPKELIMKNNRFEWTHTMLKGYDRHIFIRDIYQMWYQAGISTRISSIPALIDLMRELTDGYELTCLGISAGGYIAMLLGAKLNADKVFSLSGQIDVIDFINSIDETQDKGSKVDLSEISPEYSNLQNIISSSNADIFYFGSIGCTRDHGNLKLAAEIPNIKLFMMNNPKHHMPFDRFILKDLLNLDKQKLIPLYQKFDSKLIAASDLGISLLGWSYYYKKFSYKVKRLFKKIFRKIRKIK